MTAEVPVTGALSSPSPSPSPSPRPSPSPAPAPRPRPSPEAPETPEIGAYLSHWDAQSRHHKWSLPLGEGVVTIGRSVSADVRIDWDAQVSRAHAALECIAGHWTIEDDGLSRNGTFVNGHRIASRVRLRDHDRIRVGGTVLTFCAPPSTSSQQTVVGAGLPDVAALTAPQRAVLRALCEPYTNGRAYAAPASNAEIAAALFLSIDAVKTHLRVLFHKFGIEDLPQNQKRARLVEMAVETGLVAGHDE